MKKNKIAVLIVGNKNTGKTTTIKKFERMYNEINRENKYCVLGEKRLKLFPDILNDVICKVFFISSSPSEMNTSLENKLHKKIQNKLPEMILIAEQQNGKEYNNTLEFLNNKCYEIQEFNLNFNLTNNLWGKWTEKNKDLLLNERARKIGDVFRKFVIKSLK